MPGIDESRTFIPLNIAVLTVSDTRSLSEDRSGDTLADRLTKAGHTLADRAIVIDDVEEIRKQVRAWIASPGVDAIITTGGTGFTGRDVTPEAIEPLFEKRMEGFSTVFHTISFPKIGTSTIQSRAHAAPGGAPPRLLTPRRVGRRRAPAVNAPARLPHHTSRCPEVDSAPSRPPELGDRPAPSRGRCDRLLPSGRRCPQGG